MAALTRAELDREWRQSIARLSAVLGDPVKVASVPGGYYSREVGESAAAAGIEALFTSEPTAHGRDAEWLPRARPLRGAARDGAASGPPASPPAVPRNAGGRARCGRPSASPNRWAAASTSNCARPFSKERADDARTLHARFVAATAFAQSDPAERSRPDPGERPRARECLRRPILRGQTKYSRRQHPASQNRWPPSRSRRRNSRTRSKTRCANSWTPTMAPCAVRSSTSFPRTACR